MIRALLFLAAIVLLSLGFAWLANHPQEITVIFAGHQIKTQSMVAVIAIVAIVAALLIAWWLLRSIWNSPHTVARYFRVRKRDRGYQALSTGMIAAGAGDAALARKKNKEAARLIRTDQEPLIRLLDAQTSLLEGAHDAAQKKFEAMLGDPETRLLGLRGLFLEAQRLGDRDASRHYAAQAAEAAPQLEWATDATLNEKAAAQDWNGALKILDARKATDKATNRKRMVLLTAKAMSLFDIDFASAKTAALEANRLEPDFAPAALLAARALFRVNDTRKGSKILETAWKANPHPDIAELFVHARHGDATNDRLARARRLESVRQNNAESSLVVARAALDAGNYRLAREQAQAAIRMQPREGAWLLLADIEEAETGDIGKVRQYLAQAVRAPRDPAWVADGFESDKWEPVSPVTGRLDAFEWRVPIERLGALIDNFNDEVFAPGRAAITQAAESVATVQQLHSAKGDDAIIDAEPEPVEQKVVEPEPVQPAPPHTVIDLPPPVQRHAPEQRPAPAASTSFKPTDVDVEGVMVRTPPLPDDPGVAPEDAPKPRRFTLF